MKNWLVNNSLWLIGLALMLASSGIDGAYMSAWMPSGWGWLGLVLNTAADISGMVLMYWFGRLRQDKSSTKRKLARALALAEFVGAAYSWFFSWRQLRLVLTTEPEWVAVIAAGFVPSLLAFVGYAQALLEGRIEDAPKADSVAGAQERRASDAPVAAPVATSDANVTPTTVSDADVTRQLDKATFLRAISGLNGDTPRDADAIAAWCRANGYAPPSRRTRQRWAAQIVMED